MNGKNRFLVRGRFLDPGPLLEPERSGEVSLSKVLPSQEMLARLEESGQVVAGGVAAGAREVIFITDVDSNDELSEFISGLPFWSVLEWEVLPLQTFSARALQTRLQLEGK